jgi:hypothetical protein
MHLIKLAVGARDVADLAAWEAAWMKAAGAAHFTHHTTHIPKKRDELLNGGSLYWVIGGFILARQRLVDIRSAEDETGRQRCGFILAPEIVQTEPRPKRPFQGWRYLCATEAPPDAQVASRDMPDAMRRELAALGLL